VRKQDDDRHDRGVIGWILITIFVISLDKTWIVH